jgi:hypothetical protein
LRAANDFKDRLGQGAQAPTSNQGRPLALIVDEWLQ